MKRASHRSRSRFGKTWWGGAWIEALEKRARLDPNRLPRGRTYARSGAVGELSARAGEVEAQVLGSRARPYTVRVQVRRFDEAEWERLLDAIAARAGHAAALLDGDLDPGIVDDLAERGIQLLPEAGEVVAACSCPDAANPCKHAAAVCYLIADLLDRDPFQLMLLRGRGRDEVLGGLRRRRAAGSRRSGAVAQGQAGSETGASGVEARKLYAAQSDQGPPLPPLPAPPRHPGRPVMLASEPPHGAAISPDELRDLAVDAVERAWELCHGIGDGGLALSPVADLARRALPLLGEPGFDRLAALAGVDPRELTRNVLAWRASGRPGLEALQQAWDPSPEEIEEGQAAVAGRSWVVRRWRNRLTLERPRRQLRLGRDGLWYGFLQVGQHWELHDPPDADPHVVLGRLGLA